MAQTELKVIIKAKDLAEYTLRVTSNCNRYPKKYRFSLVDRMQIKSLNIYEALMEANRIDLAEYEDLKEQKENQGRWIPCSERLPEESLNGVIGWDEYRKRCCFVLYYDGKWNLAGENKYGASVKITAWQPVPEAYKDGD